MSTTVSEFVGVDPRGGLVALVQAEDTQRYSDVIEEIERRNRLLSVARDMGVVPVFAEDPEERDVTSRYLRTALSVFRELGAREQPNVQSVDDVIRAYCTMFGVERGSFTDIVTSNNGNDDTAVDAWVHYTFLEFVHELVGGSKRAFFERVARESYTEKNTWGAISIARALPLHWTLSNLEAISNDATSLTPIEVDFYREGAKRGIRVKRQTTRKHIKELVDAVGPKLAGEILETSRLFTEAAYGVALEVFGYERGDNASISYVEDGDAFSYEGVSDSGTFEISYQRGLFKGLWEFINGFNPLALRRALEEQARERYDLHGTIEKGREDLRVALDAETVARRRAEAGRQMLKDATAEALERELGRQERQRQLTYDNASHHVSGAFSSTVREFMDLSYSTIGERLTRLHQRSLAEGKEANLLREYFLGIEDELDIDIRCEIETGDLAEALSDRFSLEGGRGDSAEDSSDDGGSILSFWTAQAQRSYTYEEGVERNSRLVDDLRERYAGQEQLLDELSGMFRELSLISKVERKRTSAVEELQTSTRESLVGREEYSVAELVREGAQEGFALRGADESCLHLSSEEGIRIRATAPSYLRDVVRDLVTNGLDHGDARRVGIHVAAYTPALDEILGQTVSGELDLQRPAFYIKVSDDGKGFSERKAAEMTSYINSAMIDEEPTFTTRDAGEKGGMGTRSLRMFTQLQGSATAVCSEEGTGTEVYLFFYKTEMV